MKPTQAALLLILLVVMVFAVTFASMYVRDAPTKKTAKDEPQGPMLLLSFPSQRVPELFDHPAQRVVTEFGKRGQHDFWFKNENDEAVTMGLHDLGCKRCTEVEAFLAPDDWRSPLEEAFSHCKACREYERAYQHSLPGNVAKAFGIGEVEHTGRQLLARGRIGRPTPLEVGSPQGIAVPPGRFGFVRLKWEMKRETSSALPTNLSVKLWMQQPKTGANIPLGVAALFVDPVTRDKDQVSFDLLSPNETKTEKVYCWSASRPDLRLEARPTGDPFVRCEVAKINEAERKTLRDTIGPVAAGYRVTISVRERLDERTRFDEGPFEHRVDLLPFDGEEKLAPLDVNLSGLVRSDVIVQSADGGITLEPFPANRGTHHEVILSTQQPNLDLTVDRHPPFMKVYLTKEKKVGSPRWKLRLEIGRDQAAGSFPRSDNDAYKDTTIYLKIGGEGSRLLRIPVSGTATQ